VNPTQVEGQIQGGAVQGLGWALMEGYQFSESGALLNANLLDYKTPTATDVPFIDTVILEVPASDGPYGIRGVGETPIIPPLPALANAFPPAIQTTLVPARAAVVTALATTPAVEKQRQIAGSIAAALRQVPAEGKRRTAASAILLAHNLETVAPI